MKGKLTFKDGTLTALGWKTKAERIDAQLLSSRKALQQEVAANTELKARLKLQSNSKSQVSKIGIESIAREKALEKENTKLRNENTKHRAFMSTIRGAYLLANIIDKQTEKDG